MPAKPASADEAEHVLACLHEVRLNPKLGNGQKFSAQDSCFAKRTGARPAQGCAFFVKVEAGEDGDSSQPDAQNRSSQTADVLESTREARLAAERQTVRPRSYVWCLSRRIVSWRNVCRRHAHERMDMQRQAGPRHMYRSPAQPRR